MYVDSDFIQEQTMGTNTMTSNVISGSFISNDRMALAMGGAFVALFAMVWYIGNTLVDSHPVNAQLQIANELQQKALNEAYQVIEDNRASLAGHFGAENSQDLETSETKMVSSLDTAAPDTEIGFDDIEPEKVAVE